MRRSRRSAKAASIATGAAAKATSQPSAPLQSRQRERAKEDLKEMARDPRGKVKVAKGSGPAFAVIVGSGVMGLRIAGLSKGMRPGELR